MTNLPSFIASSWRAGFAALWRFTPEFAFGVLVLGAAQLVAFSVSPVQYQQVIGPHGTRPLVIMGTQGHLFLRSLSLNEISLAAFAPAMLAIQRHMLLGESPTPGSAPRLARFTLWLLGVHILFVELPGFAAILWPPALALALIGLLALPRLALIGPAIALDLHNPLPESWLRTYGHYPFAAAAFLLALLPFALVLLPFLAAIDTASLATISARYTASVLASLVLQPVWFSMAASVSALLLHRLGGISAQARK
jgi:hypothetical protein